MPVGALSKGLKPKGTLSRILLDETNPAFSRTQRQFYAYKTLSRFPSSRIGPLLIYIGLNGPGTIQDIARGLDWDDATTSHIVRRFSTGCFRGGKPEPPHAVLLWVEPQPGASGPHLQISLRPEGVALCMALLGLEPKSPTEE